MENMVLFDAEKYLKAQENSYSVALAEIKSGRKKSHWIWYIFPQIAGLGKSWNSKYYALQNLDETKLYLRNEVLRTRLITISEALFAQNGEIRNIMGFPDDMKVQSCMTLFKEAAPENEIFSKVLDKFYKGCSDDKTLRILCTKEKE